ncbi:MAG: FHA domain-containing protein [Anaerolineales bacterium]|nr:FHA domain-containing protein [Anaerolineales bacterium]
MIECPSCKHQHFVGTLFCVECGTRLVHTTPAPTLTGERQKAIPDPGGTKPRVPEGPELHTGALMGLRVLSTGDVISLLGRSNFTLGRSIQEQAVVPDIDLAPYDAYDHGVSRLHVEMRIESDGVFIVDLDSANGTLINGERLEALSPKPLHHGDVLQLGRFQLQLISRYHR